MATIFNMYKDVASPDVTSDIRESRRESEANTKKTMDTAFGMLKRSNAGTLQQQYREGSGRFEGITDPDKKFQVYYDALKALDPQAAQDAAKVYAEERQRRINREVADAYKSQGTTGNPELDAIDKAIADLESSIIAGESIATSNVVEQAQEQAQANKEQAQVNQDALQQQTVKTGEQGADYGYYNKSIDTGRMNQPVDTTLTPDEGQPASEPQQNFSKLGYVPLPRYDLRRMYDINPEFDISLSRGQPADRPAEVRQQSTPTAGMEDYVPASRYDGYVPMTRNIANMYRGI